MTFHSAEQIIDADHTQEDILRMIDHGVKPSMDVLMQVFPEEFNAERFYSRIDQVLAEFQGPALVESGDYAPYLNELLGSLVQRLKEKFRTLHAELGGQWEEAVYESGKPHFSIAVQNADEIIEGLNQDVTELDNTFRAIEAIKRSAKSIVRNESRMKENGDGRSAELIDNEKVKIENFLSTIKDADLKPGALNQALGPLLALFAREISPYGLDRRLKDTFAAPQALHLPQRVAESEGSVPLSKPENGSETGVEEVVQVKVDHIRWRTKAILGAAAIVAGFSGAGALAYMKVRSQGVDQVRKGIASAAPTQSVKALEPRVIEEVIRDAGAQDAGVKTTEGVETEKPVVEMTPDEKEATLVRDLGAKVLGVTPSEVTPDHYVFVVSEDFKTKLEEIHGPSSKTSLERNRGNLQSSKGYQVQWRHRISKTELCNPAFRAGGLVLRVISDVRRPKDTQIYELNLEDIQDDLCI